MIDYLKARICLETIDHNLIDSFPFERLVNVKSGELSNKKVYTFGSMTLKAIMNKSDELIRLMLSGSIHKHHLGKNGERFVFSEFSESLRCISEHLKMPLSSMILENIEFGVNLHLDQDVQKIIQGLSQYGNTNFKDLQTSYYRSVGSIAVKSDYRVKIYNKGAQMADFSPVIAEHRGLNILRFEIHYKKMRQLEKEGVSTLRDLLDPCKMQKVVKRIYEASKRVLHLPMSKEVQDLLKCRYQDWLSPQLIEALSKHQPQKYRRQRRELKQLVETSGKGVWSLIEHQILHELKVCAYPSLKDHELNRLFLSRNERFAPFKYRVKTSEVE